MVDMPSTTLKFSDFMEIVRMLTILQEDTHYDLLDCKNDSPRYPVLKALLDDVTLTLQKIKDIPMG